MRILVISRDMAHVCDYYYSVMTDLNQQHELIIAAPQSDHMICNLPQVTLLAWDWPQGLRPITSRYLARRRMARMIQLHRPDVIWSVDISVSDGLCRLLSKKHHWRWVVSLASSGSTRQWQRLVRYADEVIVHHAQVAPTQTTAHLIRAPAVLCPARPKALPKTPVILFYGSLSLHNALDRFLDAAKALKPFYPKAQFWVAGPIDNMQQAVVSTALQEAQAAQEITVIEQVDDLLQLIQQVSLVVMPAQLCDSIPRSMIWALAQGRAVITLNMPGICQVFEHGKQGWVVAFADRGGIALRISHALAYPECLKAMSQAAHQLAKQHYNQVQTNQALLQEILGS
jgi:glycosyltransferase involved in cell wall biosynthesis